MPELSLDPNLLKAAAAPQFSPPPPTFAATAQAGRAQGFESMIREEAAKFGHDPDFMISLMMSESSGDPTAVNKGGDSGLFQLSRDAVKAIKKKEGFKRSIDDLMPYAKEADFNINWAMIYMSIVKEQVGNGPVAKAAAWKYGYPRVKKLVDQGLSGQALIDGLDKVVGKSVKKRPADLLTRFVAAEPVAPEAASAGEAQASLTPPGDPASQLEGQYIPDNVPSIPMGSPLPPPEEGPGAPPAPAAAPPSAAGPSRESWAKTNAPADARAGFEARVPSAVSPRTAPPASIPQPPMKRPSIVTVEPGRSAQDVPPAVVGALESRPQAVAASPVRKPEVAANDPRRWLLPGQPGGRQITEPPPAGQVTAEVLAQQQRLDKEDKEMAIIMAGEALKKANVYQDPLHKGLGTLGHDVARGGKLVAKDITDLKDKAVQKVEAARVARAPERAAVAAASPGRVAPPNVPPSVPISVDTPASQLEGQYIPDIVPSIPVGSPLPPPEEGPAPLQLDPALNEPTGVAAMMQAQALPQQAPPNVGPPPYQVGAVPARPGHNFEPPGSDPNEPRGVGDLLHQEDTYNLARIHRNQGDPFQPLLGRQQPPIPAAQVPPPPPTASAAITTQQAAPKPALGGEVAGVNRDAIAPPTPVVAPPPPESAKATAAKLGYDTNFALQSPTQAGALPGTSGGDSTALGMTPGFEKEMSQALDDAPTPPGFMGQDKNFWMGIMKAGLGMMAEGSKPGATLGGSFAQGGMQGLDAWQKQKIADASTAMAKAKFQQADRHHAAEMGMKGRQIAETGAVKRLTLAQNHKVDMLTAEYQKGRLTQAELANKTRSTAAAYKALKDGIAQDMNYEFEGEAYKQRVDKKYLGPHGEFTTKRGAPPAGYFESVLKSEKFAKMKAADDTWDRKRLLDEFAKSGWDVTGIQ